MLGHLQLDGIVSDLDRLKRHSERLFGDYSCGRINRAAVADWLATLEGFPPAVTEVISSATSWFSSKSDFRKPELVMLHDLEYLLQLAEIPRE